jgi:type IV pilus assembly protein PilV
MTPFQSTSFRSIKLCLPPQAPPLAKQRGSTMIEILVAVLILSFGLLGMAALQTRALQGNQSSMQRSQATMLAYNILDAMRIDRVSVAAGNYNKTKVKAGGVTGPTLADNNIIDWLNAAERNLGGTGDSPVYGTIDCDGASLLCTVTIEWDDTRAGGLAEQKVTVQARI